MCMCSNYDNDNPYYRHCYVIVIIVIAIIIFDILFLLYITIIVLPPLSKLLFLPRHCNIILQ